MGVSSTLHDSYPAGFRRLREKPLRLLSKRHTHSVVWVD